MNTLLIKQSQAMSSVVILHTKNRQPKQAVAGINYIEATKPISESYLKELMDKSDYIAMPVTYNNGSYYPNRIHSHHETAGYALISKASAKSIAGKKRLSERLRDKTKSILFSAITSSYC